MDSGFYVALGGVLVGDLLLVWWFLFRRPQQAGRRGRVGVPGEEMVELPQGTSKLSFRVAIDRTGETTRKLEVPEGLEVAVESADGGEPAAVERVQARTQYRSLRHGTVQASFAEASVPAAGRYLVRAWGPTDGHREPEVLIG